MRQFRIRTVLPSAILALLAAAPVAAAKTTYQYTSAVMSAPVSTANGYPAPGGTAVLAGALTTKPFGPGALVDRVTITGQRAPNVFALKGTELALFQAGSSRNTFTGTATVQADGSQKLVVKGRITPGTGTGRYKNATGSYTFTGTIAAGSTVVTGSSRGTLTF